MRWSSFRTRPQALDEGGQSAHNSFIFEAVDAIYCSLQMPYDGLHEPELLYYL